MVVMICPVTKYPVFSPQREHLTQILLMSMHNFLEIYQFVGPKVRYEFLAVLDSFGQGRAFRRPCHWSLSDDRW